MIATLLSAHGQAILVLTVIGVMFALFVSESHPPAVVAITGAAILLATGTLPYQTALSVFSNPAPWTIAAMFVLSGALVRTGALSEFSSWIVRRAETNRLFALAGIAVFVVFASAFVNNTPVVVVLIPVVMHLARRIRVSASKLLIPLSYMSILGGVCTLIGTSTNLIVDGVARDAGLEPFTLFEITPLAIILAAFGTVYLVVAGRFLLPDRETLGELLRDRSSMRYFTEMVIPEGSSLVGRNPREVDLFSNEKARIIDIVRDGTRFAEDHADMRLKEGDRVMLRTAATEVLGLRESGGMLTADMVSSRESCTVEVLISPRCRMVHKTIGSVDLTGRYGIYVLAVHRPREVVSIGQINNLEVSIGDTLLIEGVPSDIRRFAAEQDVSEIAEPEARSYRRSKAPVACIALGALVILAALGVAPILTLAIIAVAVVLLTRCIDVEEALSSVDGKLMALIFSMLAVGAAMNSSGAVALIADFVAPLLLGLHPVLVVWAVYMLTSVLTELISNNAVAVVMTPIAIGVAAALGVDPRPLVITVMVAASASFATPIGYQTNTLVYGPGGYSFADFIKVGLPLNLCIGILTSLLVPLFWPL
ncbi:MAG: SLC13 family permease [Rhodobacteraceae bacterium]|nr:SLC13 family permease [Paracoccaceae bacterium]